MDWLWSNLLGGIKLRVRQEDALVASRLLEGGDRRTTPESRRVNRRGVEVPSSSFHSKRMNCEIHSRC